MKRIMDFPVVIWILCAVLFFLYGIVILSIGSGTSFFLVWFALGSASLVCAYLAHIHLWSRLPFSARVLFSVFIRPVEKTPASAGGEMNHLIAEVISA
ncbi:MAG: hypothetical protein IJV26_08520 [Lachnospiraceae bacterium]|nr:hypothetical protein [Lachnospiraceae bacterium]